MVPFRCTSTGPDGNVAADTITTITNPGSVAGITAVTNPAAFTGGRERETDEEFRDRYYASVDYAGGVNADSIRAALLQNVDGIMEAKVFENDTDDVDDYGLPPHSIEAVVYGGLDSDIAQIIYKELGAGIQTTGQKVIEVITASGATKAIHFNRPHPVPVYVKVVGLSTSGDFPHDGVDQLRAAIVAYIGDNESGGVSIGETLYHQRLPAVLYKVPGVLDFDVLIGTDAENLQADNIPVDSRSKVVTDDGMVTIDA
jgi:baseplate J-like protein